MAFVHGSRYRLWPIRLFLPAAIVLGGCSAHWHSYTATDTVCLNRQVYYYDLPSDRAVSACGTSVPDLTGDRNLQQVAMNAGVPFRVDPTLDRNVKAKGDMAVQTGASFVPIH